MRRPLFPAALSLVVVGLLSSGCESELDESAFRESFYGKLCERAYQCLSEEERQASGSLYGFDLASCKAMYAADQRPLCTPPQRYNARVGQECVDDLGSAACSELRSSGSLLYPLSCYEYCEGPLPDAGVRLDARPDAVVRLDARAQEDAPAMTEDAGAVDAPAAPDGGADDAGADAAVDGP